MNRYLLIPILALQAILAVAGQPDGDPNPVPEPETLALLAIAGAALAVNLFRNRKK
ncbi:MAG: PEP-CTERM sorting domain-containing protein [Rhodocyclaceae bacterium]|nr:PEP-CTERM sorting domain-containing protein [Rhodocyclaceae bacterium]